MAVSGNIVSRACVDALTMQTCAVTIDYLPAICECPHEELTEGRDSCALRRLSALSIYLALPFRYIQVRVRICSSNQQNHTAQLPPHIFSIHVMSIIHLTPFLRLM